MLKNIIELLAFVNGETENIRIAQGKNHLPDNLRDTFKYIKQEIKWQKPTQQNM